jgi:hypothetical protein
MFFFIEIRSLRGKYTHMVGFYTTAATHVSEITCDLPWGVFHALARLQFFKTVPDR